MIVALRPLAFVVACTVLVPNDARAYSGQGIALDAHGRKLAMATKKTKANGRTLGPSEESTKPALGRVLERYANAKLSEPLATMPIGELSAAVEALTPTSSLDRRARALAFLPYIRAIIERSPHENEVLLAIEASEKALAHFKQRSKKAGSEGVYVFAERLISQLDWALSLLLSESPPSWDDLVGALAEMDASIPFERWEEAVRAWRGQRRSSRGRPAKGQQPYRWHRVVYRLLTGKEDALGADNFRDNLDKWRAQRRT